MVSQDGTAAGKDVDGADVERTALRRGVYMGMVSDTLGMSRNGGGNGDVLGLETTDVVQTETTIMCSSLA